MTPAALIASNWVNARLQPRPCLPQIFRGAIADSGKQFHHAIKGDFIARIGHETDERSHIFDVGLFEKPDAAGDLVRDTPARKLQLQLECVIVRAVKDRDVVQVNIFIAQLENPLGNKLRLFRAIIERD